MTQAEILRLRIVAISLSKLGICPILENSSSKNLTGIGSSPLYFVSALSHKRLNSWLYISAATKLNVVSVSLIMINSAVLNHHLEAVTTLKWAFCIAVTRYMRSTDGASIIDEAEALAGNVLEQINSLQFFAVKVFIPYLSFIIDAVELCMNTTIDDFEKAFLFYALTHPDEESELLMDGTEDDDDDE